MFRHDYTPQHQNGETATLAAVHRPSTTSVGKPCHNGVNGVAEAINGEREGDPSESSWSSPQATKADSQLVSLLTTQEKYVHPLTWEWSQFSSSPPPSLPSVTPTLSLSFSFLFSLFISLLPLFSSFSSFCEVDGRYC